MLSLNLPSPTSTNKDASYAQATAVENSVVQGSSAPEIDIATRIQILIEAAMSQSRFSDSDAQLVVRQLAAELVEMEASLSDVRLAVQTLYKEDKVGAQTYLDYLEENGFPRQEISTASEQASVDSFYPQADNRAQIVQPLSVAPRPLNQPIETEKSTPSNTLSLYSGNLITELVTNSAYSALLFGERRSGTSALLRAIAYDQIAKSGRTVLDIVDLHSGQWGGLEDIRLEDGGRIVTYYALSTPDDIESVSRKLITVEAEVRRRQQSQQSQNLLLSPLDLTPYLFLIDGLSELLGALPGWSIDRRSKHEAYSRLASSLRFILSHGPAVAVSCVATARGHSRCPCDISALCETKLLFLGRVSSGHNGGYRAIDAAIEDKSLLPASRDRARFRQMLAVAKQLVIPIVFTPSGIPRLGKLANFSSYLSVDLLAQYQCALEREAF